MQSVELLLDPASTERVVGQWEALGAAGLPSQAQHRGASNAPHITIGLATSLDAQAESSLRDLAGRLPIAIDLGPIVLFEGKNSVVLARMVLACARLLALHADITEALSACPGQVDHLARGRWVPHVTLARRMKRESVSESLDVLRQHDVALAAASSARAPGDGAPQRPPEHAVSGHAVTLRRWDSDAKAAWIVSGPTSSEGRTARE